MHDFKGFLIKLTIDIIIVGAVMLGVIAAFMGTKAHAGSEWTKDTWSKYDNLVSIGFKPNFAIHLIDQCKYHAEDPINCIKIGASIAGAESSMGHRCYRYNCVGMNDGAVAYRDTMDGVNAWVMKYNKYWYKQKTPKSFYRDDGIPPVTHYCMGKKKDGVCKEGTKNSWAVFKKLTF